MLEMMLGASRGSNVKIKKASVDRDAAIVLTESGGLYCRGVVSYLRGTGVSETLLDGWGLIDTGVEDFVSSFMNGVMYRRNDNTWWGSGYVYNLGSSLTFTTKTNISPYFQLLPKDVAISKIVVGGNCTHILMANGDVYNAGNGGNGALGMRTAANSIRLFDQLWVGTGPSGSITGFPSGTKFKDIACGINNPTVYFISTDNQIYALGTAANYAMGTNNSNTINNKAVSLGSGAFTQIYGGAYCYYYTTQERSVSGIGNYYYGQVGGAKYPGDFTTGSGIPYPIASGAIGTKARVFTAIGRVWVELDGQWWYTGSDGYGVGSNTTLTRGTPTNITAGMGEDFSGAVISSNDQYFNNTVAIKDGVLYGCGYNNAYTNVLAPIKKDTGTRIFTPLDMTGIIA